MLDKLLNYFKPKQKPLSPLAQAIIDSTEEPFRWKLQECAATEIYPYLIVLVDTKTDVDIIVKIKNSFADVSEYSIKQEYGLEAEEALIVKKALTKIVEEQFPNYLKLAEEKLAKQKQEEMKREAEKRARMEALYK